MSIQKKLTWPSKKERKHLKTKIVETALNPFGILKYIPGTPIKSDFVGRKKELFILKEEINEVFTNKTSRAIRLEGAAGVGKSTLFNFLKESIEEERISRDPKTTYILKNCDIFSTYFIITENINQFSDIWIKILKGLRPEFEKELGVNISLPEYVILNFIYRMFLLDKKTMSEIIWKDSKHPKNLLQVELRDIIDPLYSKGLNAVKELQKYYFENKKILRTKFKHEINGHIYEINREDNQKLSNLFRVIDEDDPFLDKILEVSPKIFSGDDNIISYFNDLIRYYACSTGKQLLFLIGIDEVAKTKFEKKEAYYNDLGLLFIRLRELLNYTLFVFISTLNDWENFDLIINPTTDLFGQLDAFIQPMVLTQLPIEELIQVFENRMINFWNNYTHIRSSIAKYYPFSDNFFQYVFRIKKRDLRKSILLLKSIWRDFRYKETIPKLETIFESMREIRKFKSKPLTPESLQPFEWKIINDSFNDPSRFSTSGLRSSAVEVGVENAFKCLKEENPPIVTLVKNNKVIKTSKGDRKPDIYVQLHGNLGAEFRRHIEFQVKMYKKNSSVAYKHIKSSLRLFKDGYTDFLYFLMTGAGLDSKAESKVGKLEYMYKSRIRRPILNQEQQNNLFLLALYEEVTGKKLGNDKEKDIDIAKQILFNILGKDIESLFAEIKELPYREVAIDIFEQEKASKQLKAPSEILRRPQKPISEYNKPITEKILQEKIEEIDEQPLNQNYKKIIGWLTHYSDFKKYRNELCTLCLYFKNEKRESGSYKFKFYPLTIHKNIILKDAILDVTLFEALVKYLFDNNYTTTEKKSYRFTELGVELYNAIKADNYEC